MKQNLLLIGTVLLFITACSGTKGNAQKSASNSTFERPIPYPIELPENFAEAVKQGTRTESGKPGSSYWINSAEYAINLTLNTAEKKASANEKISYINNSPDSLRQLVLNLNLNQHKKGAIRNELAEATDGMPIHSVKVNGNSYTDSVRTGNRYRIYGTVMTIFLQDGLATGDSVHLELAWDFQIPKEGASGRMGWSEDNLFYLAYFYPQMAVYDDVIGWHADQFQGTAEFYADFANYTVSISAPSEWVVLGTGNLVNGQQVLSDTVYNRMIRGHQSDSVVHVITQDDFGINATKGKVGEMLTWTFDAQKVRDVAFSITKSSLWDATRANVGDLNNDGNPEFAAINTLWRVSAPRWAKSWKYAQNSIEFYSQFTGLKYPWPHMSVIEADGIINGGMEYPMMTIIGAYNRSSDKGLYGVTAHEIGHMWVPMMVNNNERRYAWMDEGFTSFHENQASKAYYDDENAESGDKRGYLMAAQYGIEGEIMRWSDYHYNGFAYGNASYSKPSTVLATLRGVLGEETFNKAYLEFMKRWQYKHPYPWDLWNTFEDVSGRDLDWFWRSWYFETWTLDQSIESVTKTAVGTEIVLKDLGNIPMPVVLEVTLSNEAVEKHTISEQVWLSGKRSTKLIIPTGKTVIKVAIDPKGLFPDIDLNNNHWELD